MIKQPELVATLWSGYGSITRHYERHANDENTSASSYIVKRVSPPARGSTVGRDEGDVRKRLSYAVERNFYKLYASTDADCGRSATASGPRFARLLSAAEADALELEDLKPDFPRTCHACSQEEARVVLSWLAGFHARFWGLPDGTVTTKADGVPEGAYWHEGGYWYLNTRLAEAESLDDKWRKLAVVVDSLLQQIPRTRKTLLHGDAKAANIFFSQDSTKCALFDLQYFGAGSPMRDVVYFLVTSVQGLSPSVEKQLLDHYLGELDRAGQRDGKVLLGTRKMREELLEDYELCLLDLWRFLLSWGLWGDTDFAEQRVDEIMAAPKWRAAFEQLQQ